MHPSLSDTKKPYESLTLQQMLFPLGVFLRPRGEVREFQMLLLSQVFSQSTHSNNLFYREMNQSIFYIDHMGLVDVLYIVCVASQSYE